MPAYNNDLRSCSPNDLVQCFLAGFPVYFGGPIDLAINALEREDASGKSFNLTLQNNVKFYWRHTFEYVAGDDVETVENTIKSL